MGVEYTHLPQGRVGRLDFGVVGPWRGAVRDWDWPAPLWGWYHLFLVPSSSLACHCRTHRRLHTPRNYRRHQVTQQKHERTTLKVDSHYADSLSRSVPADWKPSVKGTLGRVKQPAGWLAGIASWTVERSIGSRQPIRTHIRLAHYQNIIRWPPMWKDLIGR